MGVPWDECEYVGTLIGLKTVVNEFVAYQRLGEYKNLNLLTARTEAIATYAICGFSNPGSVGIMIGSMTSMAPEKRAEISSVAIRAFISGSAVCFLTACIAGKTIFILNSYGYCVVLKLLISDTFFIHSRYANDGRFLRRSFYEYQYHELLGSIFTEGNMI